MEIAELSKIARESGIVGAGGAGFPTYGKFTEQADIILMNCAECEPLLKLHRQLLKGAGIGEYVLVAQGSAARIGCGRADAPIDAAIVGIIDDIGKLV